MATPQPADAFKNIKFASVETIMQMERERSRFMSLIFEKAPSTVQYDAGGIHYVTPDIFRWTGKPARPSDSVWIVPGTLKS